MKMSDDELLEFETALMSRPSDLDMLDIENLRSGIPYSVIGFTVSCGRAESAVIYLSNMPQVLWVEERKEIKLLMKWANGVTQSGVDEVPVIHAAGLTGLGQIIGISDTGIDNSSCFFHDPDVKFPYDTLNLDHRKVIYYDTFADNVDLNGHGTQVSSVAAGNCIDNAKTAQYNGAAFAGKISFFDIGRDNKLMVPSNVNNQLLAEQYDNGARVLSFSWGTTSNEYTVDARNVDQFMWDNADALVLIAAGNDGDESDPSNTVGSPATAKNSVAVGASLNSAKSWAGISVDKNIAEHVNRNSVAGFSSRGPTSDGRLKPDVCGVGSLVFTATNLFPPSSETHSSRSRVQGTSFSAPLLAGHAALVREYFLSGFYPTGSNRSSDGFAPSGALVKAMLIHGAEALTAIVYDDYVETGTVHGDFIQGYGRAQLNNSLSFTNSTRNGLTLFVIGAVDSANENYAEFGVADSPHEYSFTVANVTDPKPIRVTLTYTDYPGTFGSTNALINDLDIELSNSTHNFYPIVTNSDDMYDRKNNLEVIVLHNPAPGGLYTVKVTPVSVVMGPQPYALVLSGEVGQHEYTPHGNDSDEARGFWPVSLYTIVIFVGAVLFGSALGSFFFRLCCSSTKKSVNPHQNV
eukprot:CAMPEP_0185022698 /NCGR_PEP_ID=MMETSP1103-20130426/5407_1 /TAXON_ID=36769 /ORGANISM="Paraphysomonas bandaiensis, Strain Caron Lab Isolate" /LENGTH=632 /DNA_ID=CAMNT_0027554897 /DNA_START=589 /DNA_END=2487 /DNA_ORIENTATION=-